MESKEGSLFCRNQIAQRWRETSKKWLMKIINNTMKLQNICITIKRRGIIIHKISKV